MDVLRQGKKKSPRCDPRETGSGTALGAEARRLQRRGSSPGGGGVRRGGRVAGAGARLLPEQELVAQHVVRVLQEAVLVERDVVPWGGGRTQVQKRASSSNLAFVPTTHDLHHIYDWFWTRKMAKQMKEKNTTLIRGFSCACLIPSL